MADLDTIRARMRADMRTTLDGYGVDYELYDADQRQFEVMLDALVEDGMHQVEQLVARQGDDDPDRTRDFAGEIVRHL